jgi:ketosteroid isomerase-like protein
MSFIIIFGERRDEMKSEENIAIAKKWFNAFNMHDLEALLSLYHNEAKHFSPKLKIRKPETNGYVQGKAALREWWQDAFERLPSLNYNYTTLTADDDRVFMEYIRKVNGEENMLIAEVLEIKAGLIVASRVYHG